MLLRRVLFLVAVIAFVVFLAPTQVGGNTGYVSVNGNSMLPLMKNGSLALVREAPRYRVGDVVAYRYPRLGVVIHRIVRERPDGTFTLKGDNNSWLDGHHPRPDEIVGKLWFHTKTLGSFAKSLQSPANAAILVGVVGTAIVATDSSDRDGRRRRGGRRKGAGTQSARALSGQTIETVLVVTLALVAASAALTFFAQRHDTVIGRERLTTFEQRATFSYTADVPPGIYDSSTLAGGDPIFPKITPLLDVGVEYHLGASLPVTVEGSYRFVARIEHPATGWTRNFEISPPTAFTEQQFSGTATLDLSPILATTRTLEEVAELQPGQTYRLSVGIEVASRGNVGPSPFEERYEPTLPFTLTPAALVLDSAGDEEPLADSTTNVASRRVEEPNEVRVLWVDAEVQLLRTVGFVGLGASALAALVVWRSFARRRSDPVLEVQSRVGRFLVGVEGGKLAPEGPRVRVRTIDDLAKVAEQEGRMILHEAGVRDHRYFVLSDEVVYYYRLGLGEDADHAAQVAGAHAAS